MLKSNNFQHYKLSTLSFLNIKIPSFSFLKKAILGLYKNLFWHISRKIGKILENFQKVPFEALLKQQKIFSKSLMKMDRFPKKKFLLKNQIVTISGVFCHILIVLVTINRINTVIQYGFQSNLKQFWESDFFKIVSILIYLGRCITIAHIYCQ